MCHKSTLRAWPETTREPYASGRDEKGIQMFKTLACSDPFTENYCSQNLFGKLCFWKFSFVMSCSWSTNISRVQTEMCLNWGRKLFWHFNYAKCYIRWGVVCSIVVGSGLLGESRDPSWNLKRNWWADTVIGGVRGESAVPFFFSRMESFLYVSFWWEGGAGGLRRRE